MDITQDSIPHFYKGKKFILKALPNELIVEPKRVGQFLPQFFSNKRFRFKEKIHLGKKTKYRVRINKRDRLVFQHLKREQGFASSSIYQYRKTKYFYCNSMIFLLQDGAQYEDLPTFAQGELLDTIENFVLVGYPNPNTTFSIYKRLGYKKPTCVIAFEKNTYAFEDTIDRDPQLKNFTGKQPELPKQEYFEQIELIVNGNKCMQGSKGVKIGVFDSGVDNDHPDLVNAKEDKLGYDYVDCQQETVPLPNDSHGTKCAGIIGATSENGVKGIAENCKIIDYRIGYLNSKEKFHIDLFSIIKAFYRAALDEGIDVINCSWGTDLPHPTLAYAIDDIFKKGRDGLGTVVVAAAGNSGCNLAFPACMENVIGVTAVNECGEPIADKDYYGWASNKGANADIAAPGLNIVTTANRSKYNVPYDLNFFGTSAASPIIAGAAGLILSFKKTLKSEIVKEILGNKAVLTPIKGQVDTNEYGKGVINISKLNNHLISTQIK